mgnify:CR=1 FL=1
MTGKTHKLGGAIAGVLLLKLQREGSIEIASVVITGSILGSLLPDIDHPKSCISRRLWFIAWPIEIMRWVVKQLTAALPGKERKRINSIMGHRGITHSLLACISVAAGMAALGLILRTSLSGGYYKYYYCLVIAIVAGMLSHLFLDIFSNGVPLFCPFTMQRVGFRWIKTGSMKEAVVGMFLVVLLIALIGKDGYAWIANKL